MPAAKCFLCVKGVRKTEMYGGGEETLYVPTKHVAVYMKIPDQEDGNYFNQQTKLSRSEHEICNLLYSNKIRIPET